MEGNDFVSHIVTGYKIWVLYNQSEDEKISWWNGAILALKCHDTPIVPSNIFYRKTYGNCLLVQKRCTPFDFMEGATIINTAV